MLNSDIVEALTREVLAEALLRARLEAEQQRKRADGLQAEIDRLKAEKPKRRKA